MTAPVLTSTLDREAPDAKARFEHNKSLAGELRSTVAAASSIRRSITMPSTPCSTHTCRNRLLACQGR